MEVKTFPKIVMRFPYFLTAFIPIVVGIGMGLWWMLTDYRMWPLWGLSPPYLLIIVISLYFPRRFPSLWSSGRKRAMHLLLTIGCYWFFGYSSASISGGGSPWLLPLFIFALLPTLTHPHFFQMGEYGLLLVLMIGALISAFAARGLKRSHRIALTCSLFFLVFFAALAPFAGTLLNLPGWD